MREELSFGFVRDIIEKKLHLKSESKRDMNPNV